ncbi:MAG: helix-turn-helix domain-containing protein [Clostridia bacterium]|nr:helix-turn-helix domain-containing protein [Clostridia bacterium]
MAFRFLNNNTVLTEKHRHNYYEYFIITDGAIIHEINGKTHELKAGDMVFIRPDDYHRYYLNKKTGCNMINISFRSLHFDAVNEYYNHHPTLQKMLESEEPPVITLTTAKLNFLKRQHSKLNLAGSKDNLAIILRSLLVEVFSYFILEYAAFQNDPADRYLESVLSQMNTPENIYEGLSALIRLSGFSHGHLCRIMKQRYNITPIRYITNLRLEYAANLLATTNYDILAISINIGISSLSHFITIFKEKYGMSPSKYRSKHNNILTWN